MNDRGFTLQLALDAANSLPNFHNTWPRIEYHVYTEGRILVTKRRIIISGAAVFRQEIITESVDHMLAQVLTESEWQNVGYATPI